VLVVLLTRFSLIQKTCHFRRWTLIRGSGFLINNHPAQDRRRANPILSICFDFCRKLPSIILLFRGPRKIVVVLLHKPDPGWRHGRDDCNVPRPSEAPFGIPDQHATRHGMDIGAIALRGHVESSFARHGFDVCQIKYVVSTRHVPENIPPL